MHHPYSRDAHPPMVRQYCVSCSHSGMNMDACRLLNLPLRPFMMARASMLGRL